MKERSGNQPDASHVRHCCRTGDIHYDVGVGLTTGPSTAAVVEFGTGGSSNRAAVITTVGPARPLSPTSRAKSAASRPTRTRRLAGAAAAGRCRHGGMVLFIPWRVGAERRAGSCPRGGHGARDQSDPLARDWTARRQSSSGANAGARAFGANDHAGRRSAGRALGGRGSSTTAPIESALTLGSTL